MDCPNCSLDLYTDLYEGVEIDRCSKCCGTWLDEGEITTIVHLHGEKFSLELIQKTLDYTFEGIPYEDRKSKVACPICLSDMFPVNYAFSSGIIIDRCPNKHGIWLDRDELEKVQIYKEDQDKRFKGNEANWNALVKSVAEDFKIGDRKIYPKRMAALQYIFSTILHILSKMTASR